MELLVLFIVLLLCYFFIKNEKIKKIFKYIIKAYISLIIIGLSAVFYLVIFLSYQKYNIVLKILLGLIVPLSVLPLWIKKNRKRIILYYIAYIIIVLSAFGINRYFIIKDNNLKIQMDVNINVYEYMPFDKNSKIYKLNHDSSLKLTSNLPIVDGAAAVFPVYSAFVNAVYPNTVKYGEDPFLYNNTKTGYQKLAKKKTDIFFGAYPSEDQIEYARMLGTEFEFTEIGKEGFVFFVNKDNPVNSLTEEQIKGIYS